ncbi:ATP-binding cassette domain-containing protein [Mucilaginibacter sp. BT774]|uniref:ABC transporter ATP-binding protein n=1 Tax=Mucilaginibacter sp. BT774 TaxID=3062276 RepID=UPI0026752226|nr:ABC transporter ATP-binding protein [Mucilaginibacter sp. BT774]MDO3626713.1 ABC transporter ATP-binding protein [Mucilaginibacter sp. BT774]
MIQVQNLDFWYKKGRPVFKNLNLSLVPGHIYGLLGKNGSGKSTLLKCISGLSFPAHGKCFIYGAETSERMVHTLANVFFLAEEVYVPALTPGQFLKNTAAFYPKFSITDFYAYLKTLDVDPEQTMSNMSYGQQKKVMIAFGVATNASVLIMDEPTNGLDIPSKVQFRKLIASVLNDERCIIISTHQVRDLDSLIDTVLILNDHKIAVNSSVDTLTDKLLFGVFENTSGVNVLYEEESMRGKHAIVQNTSGKFSKMDLELLFNAVTSGSSKVPQILEEGGGNE